MPTRKEKLLKKLELADSINLPAHADPNFPRYIVKSLDKFEEQDWNILTVVYNKAVSNGDIVKV